MEGAEPKTKSKRIRHCYPRQEVYHRFIHDNEYYYSNQAYAISSKGNYLSLGDIGRYKSVADIEKYWYSNNRVFAIIDRENKKILISHKYRNLTYELIRAIPDDYTVFHCNDDIPVYNILHDENIDTLAKLHLQHCVERYVERYLSQFYACLEGKKVLHFNIDSLIKEDNRKHFWYYEYEAIKQFVRKYKVKRRTWYNKSLNTKFKLNIYYPNYWNRITIELPTVKQVLTNTIFSKHQVDLFRKRYFYTEYCFGKGISFKDVERYWNVPCDPSTAKAFFNRHNCYWLDDYDNGCKTWNDFVIRFNQIDDNRYKTYIEEQTKKSEENLLEAQRQAALMLNGSRPVDLWRENNTRQLSTKGVKYRRFVRPTSRNKYGHWIDDYIYAGNNITFENIQLRLTKDRKYIETSRHASVPYESAKELWRKFIIWINSNNVGENPWFTFGNKNIKVGIYNLRFIRYCMKCTDNGKTLYDKNGKSILDWLIQIGCHSIWLTDVLDFINYYKITRDFPTQYALNPRVKPNINKIQTIKL